MNSEKLKTQIGNNIAAYRKMCGLTQAELADKLNYSDKAVSKWERGESVPDVITLAQLAEQFGISVGELINGGEIVAVRKADKPRKRVNKTVIQMLVSLLVWFVALFIYVVLSSMEIPNSWIGFFYAVPANAIVLLSLRSAWRRFSLNHLLVSMIMWGCLIGFYATMLIFTGYSLWKLFLLGILGQVAISLWFRMFHMPKEEKNG